MLSITLNILALIIDISYITTSCNCSYWHVSLFNEYDDLKAIHKSNLKVTPRLKLVKYN